jgi:CheY-like chemotaxis protein
MKKKAYGTYTIAKICHVMPSTVGRWIQEGKLPSFTTGGGHRRVWDSDLSVFLKSHNIPLPPGLDAIPSSTVLIVDDEPIVRRLIRKIVNNEFSNIEVAEAEDGFEAGQKVVTLAPCLVILDLKLPGINGLKVCRLIRKDSSLSRVKVLAISGHYTQDARDSALAAGADDFMGKPFESKELASRIKRLVPLALGVLAN